MREGRSMRKLGDLKEYYENNNRLSIGLGPGKGFGAGVHPPIRTFWICVCLKTLFSSILFRFKFQKYNFFFKSHQKDKDKIV